MCCYDLAGIFFAFFPMETPMKMPSFVRLLTFWLFFTVVVVHDSPTSVGIQGSPKPSPSERAVWEQEETYWRLLKTENRQQYLDLWDDRFVGWPRFESEPIRKDRITRFITERRALDYKLEPLSVREYGKDVVIALYRATVHGMDTGGTNENTRTSRLIHTWMKTEKGWQIIGGMSADDQTSPPAAPPPSTKP
jgi:hypothetical protein